MMSDKKKLINFDNSYARLPKSFFECIKPTPVKEPKLVRFNKLLANEIGLNVIEDNDILSDIFSGNIVPEGSEPIALVYAGHQFGYFVPQLGDGRAILLGEIVNNGGCRFDIQLKGSGQTSYSRSGDGRAPLGAVIREYIISEAMHSLNIPTTRSLAIIVTGELVSRETLLPGGILTRIASSHLRVGTFEYFAASDNQENLQLLADYSINRHFPNIKKSNLRYQTFLESVCDRQAALIAKWMHVGFVHGVMNSDNASISGETIDYGPCAFMDSYDPATVFSSIDHHGRYAYGNQPNIAQWNIACLGECLLPLIHPDRNKAIGIAEEILDSFQDKFRKYWLSGMYKKIGLTQNEPEDINLLEQLLELMKENKTDYTLTFRYLSDAIENDTGNSNFEKQFLSQNKISEWLVSWRKRLKIQSASFKKIKMSMQKENPAFIPRNHRIEKAIYEAVDNNDYSYMDHLILLLNKPYQDQPNNSEYMHPPEKPDHNYQTFCGT
tara:strand:- start:1504 stop:2991 length:1488 start_codon:yes stop_codon:yes gene_type:complete